MKFSFACLVLLCIGSMVTSAENEKDRKKRSIPYAGQALQATYQVLSHPIVAAALRKISMDAMATVASALNEVHQSEEKAKKTEIMSRTLDKMARLQAPYHKSMPLLQDDDGASGSGETEEEEDISGSGEEQQTPSVEENKIINETYIEEESSGKRSKIKRSKTHHRHHRHHHHHHKRNNKKKSAVKKDDENKHRFTELAMQNINWDAIANNTEIAEKIAKDSHIPVKDLLQVLHSGASRSEITKQAAAMINQSIDNQNDLSKVYTAEEKVTDDDDRSQKKNETVSTSSSKKSDDSNSDLSAHRHQHYNVTKKLTNASAVIIPNNIPDRCSILVKQYSDGEMTLRDYMKQMKLCKKGEDLAKKLANTTPMQREAVATQNLIQQQAYNYALHSMKNYRPTIKEAARAESIMDKWRSSSFGNSAGLSNNGKIPDAVKKFMTQQTPESESKTKKLQSALATMSETRKSATNPIQGGEFAPLNADAAKETKRTEMLRNPALEQQMNILPAGQTKHAEQRSNIPLAFNKFGFLDANTNLAKDTLTNKFTLPNAPVGPMVPNAALTKRLPAAQELPVSTPSEQQQRSTIPLKQSLIIKLDIPAKIPLIQSIQNKPLSGSDLVKEKFLASLANPVLQEMPVDGPLAAALKSMSEGPAEKTMPLLELHKRDLNAENKRHKVRHGKRDASDKVKSAKAIERSKMGLPLVNTQQGPKLMDKIRDISRIIATP